MVDFEFFSGYRGSLRPHATPALPHSPPPPPRPPPSPPLSRWWKSTLVYSSYIHLTFSLFSYASSRHRRMPIKSQGVRGKKVQSIGGELPLAWPAAPAIDSPSRFLIAILYVEHSIVGRRLLYNPFCSLSLSLSLSRSITTRRVLAGVWGRVWQQPNEGLPKLGSGNYGED